MHFSRGLVAAIFIFGASILGYPSYANDFDDDFALMLDEEKKPESVQNEVSNKLQSQTSSPQNDVAQADNKTNEKTENSQKKSLFDRFLGFSKSKEDVKQEVIPKKVVKKEKKPRIDLLTKISKNMKFTPDEMRYWIANTPDINACFDNGQTMLLLFVARYTDVRSLNLLIKNGADLQTHCNPRYEALLVAVASNPSADVIEILLNNGANLVDYDSENNTALMLAATYNPSASVLNVLIDYGLKVTPVNKFGFNALMLAAYENGRVPIIQTLLDNQIDINATDPLGHTALMAAALKGRDDVIRYLIFRGADYKLVDDDNLSVLDYYRKRHYLSMFNSNRPAFKSPSEQLAWEFKFVAENHHRYNQALREALYADNSDEKVQDALKHLADADVQDDNGCTMLLVAAKHGNTYSVMEKLIKARANARATCLNGKNALMILAEHSDTPDTAQDNAEKAWLLLGNGVDINATDNYGNTALIYAVRNHADKRFVQTLIEAGADLNVQNMYGETPVWILVREEHNLDTLALLLQSGADANKKNRDGLSPLWYQLEISQNNEVMKVLLANGADSNELNNEGEYPLWYAFSHAISADVINALILGQDDLNIRNNEGDTPLLFAVKHEYPVSIIELMLAKGANPDLTDAQGDTVYDIIQHHPDFRETQQRLDRDKVLEEW